MDDGADFGESPQMVARVDTVVRSAVPERFRGDEIRLTVHTRAEELPAAHYLEASASAPQGQDLVAVVSLGTVDSPDEVQIHEVRLDGHRLSLQVQISEFEGRLAANVQRLALVIIDLGDLTPGRYHAEVHVDRHVFTEYEHPETATFQRSSSSDLYFEVAAD